MEIKGEYQEIKWEKNGNLKNIVNEK